MDVQVPYVEWLSAHISRYGGLNVNYFCGIAGIQIPLEDTTDEGNFYSNYTICFPEPKFAWWDNEEGKYTTEAKVIYELRKIFDNMDESVESIQLFSIQ